MGNKIYTTSNYGMFKRLLGNRDVTETRISKIVDSIRKNGYIESPIAINEKNEIIDGQGRLEALKRLKMPVDYYVVNGAGIDQCIALNRFHTSWTQLDYINSYAEEGNESYAYLKQLIKAYPDMSMSCITTAVSGTCGFKTDTIKSGRFICTEKEYETAQEILDYEMRFKSIYEKLQGRVISYYVATDFCWRNKDVDNEKLYQKVTNRQADLIPTSTVNQACEQLEKIYNYGTRKKVYIASDYQKYIDESRNRAVERRRQFGKERRR